MAINARPDHGWRYRKRAMAKVFGKRQQTYARRYWVAGVHCNAPFTGNAKPHTPIVDLNVSRSLPMPKHQPNELSGDIGTCLHRAFSPSRDSSFDDLLARFDKSQHAAGDVVDKSPRKARWSPFRRAK